MVLNMAAYGISALGVVTGLMIPNVKNPYMKMMGAGAMVGAGVMASTLCRGAERRSAAANDIRDVSDYARTQLWYQQLVGQPSPGLPASSWSPDSLLDLSELRDTTRYPHVLVLGATGDGKSTLVEWIVDAYTNTRNLYISPTRDDFEFLNYETHGCGLRADGSPFNMDFHAINNILQALLVETEARYNMSSQQAFDRGFINAVLDEYRLTAKVGSGSVDGADTLVLENPINGQPMTYSEGVMMLITIARKRFIRLWLLLQSETVKALEMQGEGDIRESLTYLRLGHFGRSHLSTLIKAKVYPPEALEWWDAQRPHSLAMVNDSICRLPNLAQYQQEKAARLGFMGVRPNPHARPMALPVAPSLVRTPPVPQPTVIQPVETQLQLPLEIDSLEVSEPGDGVWDSPPPSSLLSSSPSNPPEIPKTDYTSQFQQMDEISAEIGGLKKTEILKRMGFKPGNNQGWKDASILWEAYIGYRSQAHG